MESYKTARSVRPAALPKMTHEEAIAMLRGNIAVVRTRVHNGKPPSQVELESRERATVEEIEDAWRMSDGREMVEHENMKLEGLWGAEARNEYRRKRMTNDDYEMAAKLITEAKVRKQIRQAGKAAAARLAAADYRKLDKFGRVSEWHIHQRNADELAVQVADEHKRPLEKTI